MFIKGELLDFAHPAVEFMITNYFYGKDNAVGNLFRKHEDFKQVPHPLLALTAAAVSRCRRLHP
jgi:hypothetical protein